MPIKTYQLTHLPIHTSLSQSRLILAELVQPLPTKTYQLSHLPIHTSLSRSILIKDYSVFRSRRWGSSLTFYVRLTVRSSPHQHERKFSGAHVCRVTFKHLPHPTPFPTLTLCDVLACSPSSLRCNKVYKQPIMFWKLRPGRYFSCHFLRASVVLDAFPVRKYHNIIEIYEKSTISSKKNCLL
jgi:hypothetical protein